MGATVAQASVLVLLGTRLFEDGPGPSSPVTLGSILVEDGAGEV